MLMIGSDSRDHDEGHEELADHVDRKGLQLPSRAL
jgi:hypothetical protein